MFEKADQSTPLQQAVAYLRMMHEDVAVPKGLKEKMLVLVAMLEGADDVTVKKSKALTVLGDLSEDPNMPAMTRTQLYSVISLLEVA